MIYRLIYSVIFFSLIYSNINHLVFSRVTIRPNQAELISIYNPASEEPLDLSNYYITDSNLYYNLPSGTGFWSESIFNKKIVKKKRKKKTCKTKTFFVRNLPNLLKNRVLGKKKPLIMPRYDLKSFSLVSKQEKNNYSYNKLSLFRKPTNQVAKQKYVLTKNQIMTILPKTLKILTTLIGIITYISHIYDENYCLF